MFTHVMHVHAGLKAVQICSNTGVCTGGMKEELFWSSASDSKQSLPIDSPPSASLEPVREYNFNHTKLVVELVKTKSLSKGLGWQASHLWKWFAMVGFVRHVQLKAQGTDLKCAQAGSIIPSRGGRQLHSCIHLATVCR